MSIFSFAGGLPLNNTNRQVIPPCGRDAPLKSAGWLIDSIKIQRSANGKRKASMLAHKENLSPNKQL